MHREKPEMPVKQNAPAEDSDQAHKVNGYQKRINETVAHFGPPL
jgi:hypothetical protein